MSSPPFRPHRIKTKKSEGLWLTSMADLSLLLMSFFALMLSFSKPNKKEFDNVVTKMQPTQQPISNLETVAQDLRKSIARQNLSKEASVRVDADGLALEFSDQLMFASGSAKASPEFQNTVGQVLQILSTAPDRYRLTIEGHTDDRPLRGGRQGLGSNWDLSAARGITLLHLLEERGVATSRMRVLAYADTLPKVPVLGLVGQALEEARRANRRVVIRLE